MTRNILIEEVLRQIHNGYIPDDSEITFELVNQFLNAGIGVAAKQNYKDSVALDAVGYVNNSFYSTFKGLALSKDENFLWKLTLPQIPIGIGKNEGISNLRFKDTLGNVSLDGIPLSENQKGVQATMRPIPNKVLYYTEGVFCYVLTTILMNQYTASVTLISGGDDTNLDSVLNVPQDYIPIVSDYIKQQLLFERSQPKDVNNDGSDNNQKQ